MGVPRAPEVPADAFFSGHELARAAHERVCALLDAAGPYTVRITASQVAYRRRRGFAYLWTPSRHLHRRAADAVLSLDLPEREASGRFKEVVHVGGRWLHHLELRTVEDLDAEVAGWLARAAAAAT